MNTSILLPKTASFRLGRYSVLAEHHTGPQPYTVAIFKDNAVRSTEHFDNRQDATFSFNSIRRAIIRNNS